MKRSKFGPAQIEGIRKEFGQGKDAESISREYGISKATFYKWRQRNGGMEAEELKKMKRLEELKVAMKATSKNGDQLTNIQSEIRQKKQLKNIMSTLKKFR